MPKVGINEPDRDVEHTGIVDEWVSGTTGGWGFLRSDRPIAGFTHSRKDGRIFVHRENISVDVEVLEAGQKVAFKVKPPLKSGRDWQANEVRLLENPGGHVDTPAATTHNPGAKKRIRKRDETRVSGAEKDKKAAQPESPEFAPLDPILSGEEEADDADVPNVARASVVHGVLGRMKVNTIPHFGQIMPLGSVQGHLPSAIRVEGLIWEPKEVPGKEPTWEARPVDPSLLALQRIAGMKPEDADGAAKLTLHFALCREHAAVGLKTATVGPVGRDPRYGKFMGPPMEEGDLVRLGLREARMLPALTGQQAPPQGADTAPEAVAGSEDAAGGEKKEGADGDKSSNKEQSDKTPGIRFTQHASGT